MPMRSVTNLGLMRIAVHHLALACCAVEVATAIALDLPATQGDMELVPATELPSSFDLSVLVIAGTISKPAEARLRTVWGEINGPKLAIAYGVCASSGGPYWDSYGITQGAEVIVPISRFVPGCPPPRTTLIDAVVQCAQDFVEVR